MDTPLHMGRFPVRSTLLSAAVGLVTCSGFAVMVEAQANPRSTFPGRRVGGGTRGECSARSLIHLVPESSVYAPGSSGLIGLLQGPSSSPVSLTVSFKPENGSEESTRTLPATPANIVLMAAKLQSSTVWESSFNCNSGERGNNSDPMAFVQAIAPPALSLLVLDVEPSDQPIQKSLNSLQTQCGKTVSTSQAMAQFGLSDLITEEWPKQLPVRCLS